MFYIIYLFLHSFSLNFSKDSCGSLVASLKTPDLGFLQEREWFVLDSCWISAIDTALLFVFACPFTFYIYWKHVRGYKKKKKKAWNVATHLSSSARGGALSHSYHSCLSPPFAFSRSLSGMICFPNSICSRSARFTMHELIKRFGAFFPVYYQRQSKR